MRLWRNVPKSLRTALYWSPTALCLAHSISIKQISGRSMQQPTLNPDSSIWKDIAIFDRITPLFMRPYQRGDIVTVRSPTDPERTLIKRIVALEGDIVETRPPCAEPEVEVPPGYIWIEGDESFRTNDSNLFGPVPLGLVESRLVFLVWPLDRIGSPSISVPQDRTNPAYRLAMDQIQRERSRQSRIIPAVAQPPG
ncbi:hypothetical protein M378DRAFT_607283 [Amanita muscaria Koide BX008]|uniref:Mitochondrial inner membrane protease subunit 2 n=1 Tax=Amanita muscaria (strain Koide BX008) TaxID=946122 RepID=A0A0C2T2T8_AMAMK|nr:hypothetical protein M378DRAFT_607283 [Amanita muscaria Koide BX008]